MFRIPESIADLIKERGSSFPIEGFVYGQGPQKPQLMLIGEAPGEFEIVDGIPFIGRAGTELLQSLDSIGLTRDDVYMTSPVRSRPYKWGTKKERDGTVVKRKYNRPPTQKEILAHAPALDYELAHLEPKLIVTMGNVGLQRLIGKEAKVTELHGQLLTQPIQYLRGLEDKAFSWTEKSYSIVPTFHPASVFYRPSHRTTIEADWQKIGQLLEEINK
ncbi:uracil-DNA glycosylase [Sporosarcina sp. HYO08]|uniref:uracil-DNA glycosylase n=1 Tax=Sporosarcina sp. HYO08 TaxID=1759557 RepID=UPI0007922374|nr:uracil-DNA glycosylase [Sporosarcina sp. HYO08]KXH80908.1 uracil-DNA glycosylase [Sporosarcina sp. HYO08]